VQNKNRIEEDMQDVQDRGEERKIAGWQDGQDEKRLIVQLKFYPVHQAILFFLFPLFLLHHAYHVYHVYHVYPLPRPVFCRVMQWSQKLFFLVICQNEPVLGKVS
jgi:hypothetical protein